VKNKILGFPEIFFRFFSRILVTKFTDSILGC